MPAPKKQRFLFGDDSDAAGRASNESPASQSESDRKSIGPSEQKQPFTLADLKGKTVYVVDAPSLIYQVFHAIGEMTSPQGQPVNAVYGFTRDVMAMLEGGDADFLLCAFDAPGPTFRHELYAEYKADRAAMPDDLRPQMPLIRRVLDHLRVPALELPGFEADDLLATVAEVCQQTGAKCLLLSGDKDCRQLIDDSTFVFNVRKQQIYDARALQADWGIAPEQVVDFQALVGDKIDNVPGVPLIGPKIAGELLREFGDLESVLANVDKIKGAKRKENLTNYKQQALLSRDLVRLDRHAPIEIDWEGAQIADFDYAAALKTFVELGFHGFAEKVRQLSPEIGPAPETETTAVETKEGRRELLDALRSQEEFAFALLPLDPVDRFAPPLGIAFCWEEGRASYVPLSEADCPADKFLQAVCGIESATMIGHNLKAAWLSFSALGVAAPKSAFDTQLASYLLDAGERDHSLVGVSKRYLGRSVPTSKEVLGSRKSLGQLSISEQATLAGTWAEATMMFKQKLEHQMQQAELEKLFRDVESPLIHVLETMESDGIALNKERLNQLSEEFATHIQDLEQQIHSLAGSEFNIASPKQLQQVLFEQLGLPMLKRTAKSGPSTDSEVLAELAEQHPIAALILEHRQYAKLKGTYLDALPNLVRAETGRVHADFNQMVAATGRLSCQDPNLQNIPIRTNEGRKIRSVFVASENGWELLTADYSQIELRVLAELSGDQALRSAFERDQDIHTSVAAQVFGMKSEDVNADQRRRAKAVNFGVIYGQTPFGLSKQLGISTGQAAEFIDAYFAQYPGVEAFLAKILAECAANGYVKTVLGRRRFVRGIRRNLDSAKRQRNLPERTAINTVIQGSAADLIKLAMLRIQQRVIEQSLPARLLLQIHDELVFEVPSNQIQPLAELVSQEMSQVLPFEVPLKVDLSCGANLAETHSL